ncbi:hypothetical protein ABVC38_00430 [Lactobacillus iners]|uniref:hypothetical protein n=1 Tax=Lactobacillus iners TaxID=147802 RepID=UPI0001E5DDD4|nr:hypothetical protein HMPREF9212_1421 [Lactobacillus iners LactinV 03V1-b]MCT7689980.1 hypothetical protein [Lactobacillus crispatus]MCT7739166.1 hypothetical protein [Lactobacillus iners]
MIYGNKGKLLKSISRNDIRQKIITLAQVYRLDQQGIQSLVEFYLYLEREKPSEYSELRIKVNNLQNTLEEANSKLDNLHTDNDVLATEIIKLRQENVVLQNKIRCY